MARRGAARAARPLRALPGMKRILSVLAVLTVVLVSLLAFNLRAQDEALRGPTGGSGEVEGVQLRVSSKLSARLQSVEVAKGASVKKGDVLARLDCAEPEQLLVEARARLAAAEAAVPAAEAQVLVATGNRQALSRASAAAEAQARALAAQRDASRRQADRLEAVAGDVALSSRDQVRASATGLEHQVDAAKASAEMSAEQARAAGSQAKGALAQVESARLQAKAAESAVLRAELLVAECRLVAPRDGLVSDVVFEAGELVAPGAVVVKLVDLRELTATVYVPNAELARVKVGGRATVVADALPGRPFPGTVRTVSFEAEFTPRNIQTRSDRDRLVYPVEIAIANPDLALRSGMPVHVTLGEN